MSHLSNTINQTVEAALSRDGFEPRKLAPVIWEQLDEESRASCGHAELIRRMKTAAKELTKDTLFEQLSEQAELPFVIDGAVSLGGEKRMIKRTSSLTKFEFGLALKDRKKQLKADTNALKSWTTASKSLAPYWEKHPDWTVGQCTEALAKEIASKAA